MRPFHQPHHSPCHAPGEIPGPNASGIGLTPCELNMSTVASLGKASAFEANEVMHKVLVASHKFRWLLDRATVGVSLAELGLVKFSVGDSRMLLHGRPRFLFVEVATNRLLIDEVEVINQLCLRDSSSELSKRFCRLSYSCAPKC